METYAGTKVTTALGKITAVLAAAFLAVLFAGCAAQTGGLPPTATGVAPPATGIPRAVQPITMELMTDGELGRATDANGAVVPNRGPTTAMPVYFNEGAKRYLIGTGMMISPGNPAVTTSANCVQEQGKLWQCVPRDRSGWLQVNRRGVQQVYYVLDDGRSVPAGRPAGTAPIPTGKGFSFARRPQAPGAAYQAPGAALEAEGSCPCCADGYCWDPFPQCS